MEAELLDLTLAFRGLSDEDAEGIEEGDVDLEDKDGEEDDEEDDGDDAAAPATDDDDGGDLAE